MLDEPKAEDDDEDEPPDSMAVAIASPPDAGTAPQDPFALYVVDSEGPPLVHVSRTRRSEIVIFGRQQKLLTPLVLGTGPILLNAADSDEKIEISKIVPSQYGDADAKITTSLELADVVRQAANLAPAYPEIVADSRDGQSPEEPARPAGRRRRARLQHRLPRSRSWARTPRPSATTPSSGPPARSNRRDRGGSGCSDSSAGDEPTRLRQPRTVPTHKPWFAPSSDCIHRTAAVAERSDLANRPPTPSPRPRPATTPKKATAVQQDRCGTRDRGSHRRRPAAARPFDFRRQDDDDAARPPPRLFDFFRDGTTILPRTGRQHAGHACFSAEARRPTHAGLTDPPRLGRRLV